MTPQTAAALRALESDLRKIDYHWLSTQTYASAHIHFTALADRLAAVLTQEGAECPVTLCPACGSIWTYVNGSRFRCVTCNVEGDTTAPAEPRAGAGNARAEWIDRLADIASAGTLTHEGMRECSKYLREYANKLTAPTAAAAVPAAGDAIAWQWYAGDKWADCDFEVYEFAKKQGRQVRVLFDHPAPKGGVTEAQWRIVKDHLPIDWNDAQLQCVYFALRAALNPPAAQAQDAGPMARHLKQSLAEFADIHMSEQVCDEVLKLARALAAKEAK